ncbi:hypothetical protein [Rubritalea marina]|uniref:hypothetical protein n=1 Tax=Rubritalea marina TaxID=361055 RepID=UPI0003829727|nr:hypothetical protein [Rubritalea marina]
MTRLRDYFTWASLMAFAITTCTIAEAQTENKQTPDTKMVAYCLNGDTISGHCTSVNEHAITLKPSYTKQAIELQHSQILYLEPKNKHGYNDDSLTGHEAKVQLKHRYGFEGEHETVSGSIQQIDDHLITIKPQYAESIKIDRSLIHSIHVIRPESRIYSQVIDLDEWQSFGDPTGWVETDKGVISRNQDGRIAKEFELPDLVRLSLEIDWKKRLGVSLYLFASSADRPTPLNAYELRLQHSYMYMSKTVNGVQVAQPHRIKHTNYSHKSQLTHIEILMNRMTGSFITFLNGTLVHTFQDPNPTPGVMGGAIYILNGYNEPIRFKQLNIEHWNGNSDATQKQFASPSTIKESRESIHLINGDIVPGIISGVGGQQLQLNTQFSPSLNIPLERVHKIDQHAEENQPKAEQHDCRLIFKNDDQWIVQINSLDERKLHVTNKAFGVTEIDTSSLRKVEFNIYNDRINATRYSENW